MATGNTLLSLLVVGMIAIMLFSDGNQFSRKSFTYEDVPDVTGSGTFEGNTYNYLLDQSTGSGTRPAEGLATVTFSSTLRGYSYSSSDINSNSDSRAVITGTQNLNQYSVIDIDSSITSLWYKDDTSQNTGRSEFKIFLNGQSLFSCSNTVATDTNHRSAGTFTGTLTSHIIIDNSGGTFTVRPVSSNGYLSCSSTTLAFSPSTTVTMEIVSATESTFTQSSVSEVTTVIYGIDYTPSSPSQTCGNGILEGSEVCDGPNLNSQTCITQGFVGGTLRCQGCTSFDTSSCTSSTPICGNGVIEAPETCDGNDFGGITCSSYGYGYGTLRCSSFTCSISTGQCFRELTC